MSVKHLHIVAFDIPSPPNYGGVIDVYYKIRALAACGVHISLHVFEYGGRKVSDELRSFCQAVYVYPRKKWMDPVGGKLPYIVASRSAKELLNNLLQDESPILFEGLHSCSYLHHPALKQRTKLVRMHNIEHHYYARLADTASNPLKKFYFKREANRLEDFTNKLRHAQHVLAISPNDEAWLKRGFEQTSYLPAFHANQALTSLPGKGDFCFYHGKLSIGENDEAACFLAEEVFNELRMPLVIAGNDASARLRSAVAKHDHIRLMEDLPTDAITKLCHEAQVNVVPTFQPTGIKLKLLNVLYQGRHVLANREMVDNTGLQDLCTIATNAQEFRSSIQTLMQREFTLGEMKRRETVLKQTFDTRENAARLANLIFRQR